MTTTTPRIGTEATTVPRSILGRMLRNLRLQTGMSQVDVAVAAELTAGYLSRVEAGERTPRPETITSIARALEADSSLLLIAAGYLPATITRQIEDGTLEPRLVQIALLRGLNPEKREES